MLRKPVVVASAFAVAMTAVLPSIAEAKTAHATYYGGHVISHVEIVPVFWGTAVSQDVVSGAPAFYAKIVDSPYMDWLGEYDTAGLTAADSMPGTSQHINRGTTHAAVTITPTITSGTLSDAAIQKELLAQIASGKLPKPQLDAQGGVNTLYMISFPTAVKVKDFAAEDVCTGGCAYHWTVTVPGVAAGVPYGVLPDCSKVSSQCNMSTVFQTFTGDASHELVEAITDPECGLATGPASSRPMAWFDSTQANGAGEVGDICLSQSAFVSYQGYTVQTAWSERTKKCITNDPSLKLCDGKTRPCTPCAASDCSGGSPICDTDMTSSTWGQCVSHAGGGSGSGGSGSSGSGGGSGSGAGASSGSGAGGGSSGSSSGGGSAGAGEGEAPTGDSQSSSGGCSASSSPRGSGDGFLLLGAAVLGLSTRRRTRRA